MTKVYTVSQLSKLTSVSIRTLHYYDEINLLKPRYRTSKKHRLYSEDDILCLQQIITFKYIGLTLSQIRKLLHKDKAEIFKSIEFQAAFLHKEAKRIESASKFFDYLLNQYNLDGTISWNNTIKIIEVLKIDKSESSQWYQICLNPEEQSQFKNIAESRSNEWITLFKEIKTNLHTDPEGRVGIRIVKKVLKLIRSAYDKYPELQNKLWEAYTSGALKNENFPYDKDVIKYLSKAHQKLKKLASDVT